MTTLPRAIVTSTYRYKRLPRKKKPVLLEVPVIVQKGAAKPEPQKVSAEATLIPPPAAAHDDRQSAETSSGRATKSAIITVKGRRSRFGDAPDMTLEEHQRRGDAADTLFREIVLRATE